MTDCPKLRLIDAFPIERDGTTVIYLKDPLNLAKPLAVSPLGYFILAHFDGRHSLIDVQEAYSKRFGALLFSEELRNFIDMLDENYYLESERFQARYDAVVEEFRRLAVRPTAHAGGAYPADPAELTRQLDSFFTSVRGPGMPESRPFGPPPRAVVAPHIDFHRGGPGYAWAYKPLAESEGADLYILLGTSHSSGRTPYILTPKDFATPLGPVETDREFVQRLQARCEEDCFVDEYLHRGEHSLEFQAVWLKYIARKRAALTGAEKPFKIVPILVSSFHAAIAGRVLPEESSPVEIFLKALRELAAKERRRVCLIAAVDLAHVGRQFGDREPVTDDFLKWVESEDRDLIDRLAALDAPGFFQAIAKDRDKRRICGFSPLYSLIHLLDGARGQHLNYSQAFTPETGSAVTFTSMVFE